MRERSLRKNKRKNSVIVNTYTHKKRTLEVSGMYIQCAEVSIVKQPNEVHLRLES